jgi:PEP-CTERM motif
VRVYRVVVCLDQKCAYAAGWKKGAAGMSKLNLFLLHLALLTSAAQSQQWQFTPITNGGERFLWPPKISGSDVVWQQYDGHDYEIYRYDGSTISRLTDNDEDDVAPDVSNGHIAWIRGDDDDTDIIYDGITVMEGVRSNVDLKLEPGGLVWSASNSPDLIYHVYLFDGTTTKQLSIDGAMYNSNPDMSGNKVVWWSYTNNVQSTYLYDGVSSFQLPENVGRGQGPHISGDNIVGTGLNSEGIYADRIFLYDGVTNHLLAVNPDGSVGQPRIAGQNAAWRSCVANTLCEVFVYQDGQAKQVSFDSIRLMTPQVSESFVVFNAYDGQDWEIFAYDGVKTVQLTDNDIDDRAVDISGNSFVWIQAGPDYTTRIYTATYVPEPSTLLLCLLSIVGVALMRRPRRPVESPCDFYAARGGVGIFLPWS